jgi:hypothetical protein
MRDLLGEGVPDKTRDQDHRHVAACTADGVQDDQAVHVRHHDVDDRQIGRRFLKLPEGLVAAGSPDHLMALECQDVI